MTCQPIPASMLRARAREKEFESQFISGCTDDRYCQAMVGVCAELGWANILDEFEFPKPEVYNWPADAAPPEVMEQLIGQTIGLGMKICYQNEVCLVVDLDIRPDELGRVLCGCDLDDYWRPITLVPLKYIDLNS